MNRPYNRRRTGPNGMGAGVLDLLKPRPALAPLIPGQAPPGQGAVNRLFGATPENPIRLPFQPIDTSIEFSPQGMAVLLGTAGVVSAGLIIAAVLKR